MIVRLFLQLRGPVLHHGQGLTVGLLGIGAYEKPLAIRRDAVTIARAESRRSEKRTHNAYFGSIAVQVHSADTNWLSSPK